jgi:hypothetical protein
MTPKEIQNKLNEAVMNIQSLQAELDKLKSNRSEIPNSYDHLLPAGYEFCAEEEAEKWVKVKISPNHIGSYELGRIENSISFDELKPYYRPIRPIQYHVAVHEAVTAESNPYAVDWSNAPEWSDVHCFDANGNGYWWGASIRIYDWIGETKKSPFTLPTGLDWKLSKTTRP